MRSLPLEITCDVLIVGGGVGGCAAAMAAASLGASVVMTEETTWIGGQLTNQLVPPDEHPWIESFGRTRRYAAFREGIREHYRQDSRLKAEAQANPLLNPGGGWVSRLCFEPALGVTVLESMLAPYTELVTVLRGARVVAADVDGDCISAVSISVAGENLVVRPQMVLDSSETGSLLPLVGAEYVVGAESQAETGEPHALPGDADPNEVQGITWCAIFSNDPGSNRVIDKPAEYEKWLSWKPGNWCGPLLSLTVADPFKGGTRVIPIESLLTYRQLVDPSIYTEPVLAATCVNWPQNDFFDGTVLDVPDEVVAARLESSRQLTLSLLYWLQTEAGYPGLYLRPDLTGTSDGLAMAPYIRESRRIRSRFTVAENHVSAELNPGFDRAPRLPKSVGVGAYRLDLHPGSNGAETLDLSSLPFQIPLGSLIPVRMRNLLAAGKNLGVTHVANGCYRLHPVEWNVGESAGLLAAFCLNRGVEPAAVFEDEDLWQDFERLLADQGIETAWPDDSVLKPL